MAGNGEGGSRANWQLIIVVCLTTLGAAGAVVGAFWSLADPRAEVRAIRENYLTLREHEEFVRRFNSDIARIEGENRTQISRTEVETVWKRRAAELAEMHKQLDDLRGELQLHERDDRAFTSKVNGK